FNPCLIGLHCGKKFHALAEVEVCDDDRHQCADAAYEYDARGMHRGVQDAGIQPVATCDLLQVELVVSELGDPCGDFGCPGKQCTKNGGEPQGIQQRA